MANSMAEGAEGHDHRVSYDERPAALPDAVLWRRQVASAGEVARILPDGCVGLIWDGRRMFVAGPDTSARLHRSEPGAFYISIRFSGGLGPALLGMPANELTDSAPSLDELWPAAEARRLSEQVAADAEGRLEAWAVERAVTAELDPLGPRVFDLAERGASVAAMATRLGYGERQLRRRCQDLFGYGPRRLTRIRRLGRAVAATRAGLSLSEVAQRCGYADQAHLSREVRDLAGTTPAGLRDEFARPTVSV
jgi:AraC-like DNA-binding protein